MVLKVKKKTDLSYQHPEIETLKEVVSTEDRVRLNLQIPANLRRAVKARAASEGRSVQDLVIALLDDYLHQSTNPP